MARLDGRGRRARRSASAWRAEIEAWRASGQSAAQYAKEKDLSPQTLKFWAKRLMAPEQSGAARKAAATGAPSFLPVQVTASPATHDRETRPLPHVSVEIALSGGGCVRVSGELDAGQLTQLVQAAQKAQGGGAC